MNGKKNEMPGRVCEICKSSSYKCEFCKSPCCTPCSNYDPEVKETVNFPKGRDGGIRNHPACILKAMEKNNASYKRKKKGTIEDDMTMELKRMERLHISIEGIIATAIQVAAHPAHRMIIKHGKQNKADGNCAPEAANDNHNQRDELSAFRDVIFSTPQDLREAVVKDMTNNERAFQFAGYRERERWKQDMQKLKQSGEWTSDISDLMIPGISYTLSKNILIINTKPQELSKEPITLICPETFGGNSNTEIPLLLAYNGVHFEGMVPESTEDIRRSEELVRDIKKNEYFTRASDIPCLLQLISQKERNLSKTIFDSPAKKRTKSKSHDQNALQKQVHEANSMQSESVNEAGKKKCLCCKTSITTYIPHLKKNDLCLKFYLNKYELTSGTAAQNLNKLKDKLKLVEQSKRRENELHKNEINKRQREQRQQDKSHTVTSCNSFWEATEAILSTFCQLCECFLSPNYSFKIERDHQLFVDLGEVWICKLCTNMLESINQRWLKLEDGNSCLNKLYDEWAKENFSIKKKLFELKSNFTSNRHPLNVGFLNFKEQNKEFMVCYPILNIDEYKESTMLNEITQDRNEPTFLLSEDMFVEDQVESVLNEVAQLAGRSCHTQFTKFLSLLYMDRHERIMDEKNRKVQANSQTKRAKKIGGELSFKEVTSLQGCLHTVKGSKDYVKKRKNNNVFAQYQNGTTNLKVCWTVFPGFSAVNSDTMLALCILRTKGYKFHSFVKRREGANECRGYKMECQTDCDPFSCTLKTHHPTPLEMLNSLKEEIDPLLVARFINEKIISFINKCVKPIAKQYNLFLMFKRPSGPDGNSSIQLCGNIWTEDLSIYSCTEKDVSKGLDLIPDVLKEDQLKNLLGDHGGYAKIVEKLEIWPDHVYNYEEEPITTQTSSRLQSSELDSFRETSLFEFLFCSVRNLSILWSSQSVFNVDTQDPRNCWMTLKKADAKRQKDEACYFDLCTKTWWVEAEGSIRDYKRRPLLMEALLLLQMCVHYR